MELVAKRFNELSLDEYHELFECVARCFGSNESLPGGGRC